MVLYPDTPCSSPRERLEGVVRREQKQDDEEALMSYPSPVECEVNEMEFDCEDSMDPYDGDLARVREKKNQTFTHAQRAMGGNILLTARSIGLQAARLRAWTNFLCQVLPEAPKGLQSLACFVHTKKRV